MKRTDQLSFDLGETDKIWVRPREECKLFMDFGEDVSGWTFVVYIEEHKWPYMPYSYEELTPTTISTGFTFTDNVEGVTNAVWNLTIAESQITDWRDKKLDFRLQVNDGTNTWIAADRSLVVAQGD